MTEANACSHPLGGQWLSEVDALVRSIRGRDVVRFSIPDVARRSRVKLETRSLPPRLFGLTLNHERVLLSGDLRGAQANFTFAHELAHVYRRRGHFAGLRSGEEEWFADWFAREMLLPREWLQREWRAPHLAALHVDRITAALQLAVVGRAPEIMRLGDRVLCRTCGTRHQRAGCRCAQVRRALPASHRRLPEVPSFHTRPAERMFMQLSILESPRDELFGRLRCGLSSIRASA